MKPIKLALLLSMVFSTQLQANGFKDQLESVKESAKQTRHYYYTIGSDQVQSSSPVLMRKKDLDTFYQNNKNDMEVLDRKQVGRLYQCNQATNCSLWYFAVQIQQYGGTGVYGYFALVSNNDNSVKDLLTHTIYEE